MEFELKRLTEMVLDGNQVDKDEALWLYRQPLEELARSADRIRRHYCGDYFDLCSLVNAKSGRCSENCKFCSQSASHHTLIAEYPLLDEETILAKAALFAEKGALRFSMVTAGRRLSDDEVDRICAAARRIKETVDIAICVSVGLLTETQFRRLKDAGVARAHNNLETSRRNFPNVCTTHTFDDKIRAIRAAKAAGLSICSGGIMGLGETPEDRIDMAFSLRELGVRSVCVNMLNAIAGTPLELNERLTEEDMCRIVAVYRFILPTAYIRLAGGRGLLSDKGKRCFTSGANAAISGDMLTTPGVTIERDRALLEELGYETKLCDD